MNAEKAFDKNPLSFHTKNTQQSRNKGGFSARWKSIFEKPTTNIILKGERLNVCPWDQELDKDVCPCHLYSMFYWRFYLAQLSKKHFKRKT